jgi:hypothetical protein
LEQTDSFDTIFWYVYIACAAGHDRHIGELSMGTVPREQCRLSVVPPLHVLSRFLGLNRNENQTIQDLTQMIFD